VCIGHSHIQAVASAATELKAPWDVIAFWVEPGAVIRNAGEATLRPDLAERVAVGAPVLSFVGGSAHSTLGMVEHPRPFDFVLPSSPDLPLDPDRELVPASGVRAALAALDAEYVDLLSMVVRAAKGAPVTQLEPPPPLADSERIFANMPWGFFPDRPRIIAPRWLRLKVWRMHSEMMAACCARLGVGYLRAPPEAQDADGFLKAGLDSDGIHAGPIYGRMVIESLERGA